MTFSIFHQSDFQSSFHSLFCNSHISLTDIFVILTCLIFWFNTYSIASWQIRVTLNATQEDTVNMKKCRQVWEHKPGQRRGRGSQIEKSRVEMRLRRRHAQDRRQTALHVEICAVLYYNCAAEWERWGDRRRERSRKCWSAGAGDRDIERDLSLPLVDATREQKLLRPGLRARVVRGTHARYQSARVELLAPAKHNHLRCLCTWEHLVDR